MEETNVIEMEETQEAVNVKKSKVREVLSKVGSGIKKNWKPIAIGAGAFAAGMFLGKNSKITVDDEEMAEEDDLIANDPVMETEN